MSNFINLINITHMKKFFVIVSCLLAISTTGVYAQAVDKEALKAEKAAIKAAEGMAKKAQSIYNSSKPDPQMGRKETNFEKLEEGHAMIKEAIANKYNANNAAAFATAAEIEYLYFNKISDDIKADPENVELKKQMLDCSEAIVNYCTKWQELADQDPKMKEDQKKVNHTRYQQLAANPVLQCLQGAQYLGNAEGATVDDQKKAVRLAKLVYNTFEKSPLFADFAQKGSDGYKDWILYSKVFSAQPLLQIPDATEAEVEEAFTALMDTKFAESAYLQLANYYRERNQEKYVATLKKASTAMPDNHAIAINLFNHYFINKQFDDAVAQANTMIEKFPEDAADMQFKVGVVYFNQEKYAEALDNFEKAYARSNDVEHLKNAAIASVQMVIRNESKDKAVIDKLNKKAIELLEQYETLAPEDSELWGPRLYSLYYNTQNTAKAKQYAKYNK